METTVILGIGNTLMGDDGAGVHAVARLRQRLAGRPGPLLLDGGTLNFTLAESIAGARRLIVIDATELYRNAGAVAVFLDADLDRFLRARRRRSVHEVGLTDLFDMARLAGDLPTERALIGIQPARIGWGTRLSQLVEAALDEACRNALALTKEWSHEAA